VSTIQHPSAAFRDWICSLSTWITPCRCISALQCAQSPPSPNAASAHRSVPPAFAYGVRPQHSSLETNPNPPHSPIFSSSSSSSSSSSRSIRRRRPCNQRQLRLLRPGGGLDHAGAERARVHVQELPASALPPRLRGKGEPQ